MFCKYCGKPMKGTSCDSCGTSTVLREKSEELIRLMAQTQSQETGTAADSMQKGLAQGYENGLKDGLIKGQETEKALWLQKIKLGLIVVLASCLVLVCLSSIISYHTGYNNGDEAGYVRGEASGIETGRQQGYVEGSNQLSTVEQAAYTKGRTEGYNTGYGEGFAAGVASVVTPVPDPTPSPSPTPTSTPESNSIVRNKRIQERLHELGYYDGDIDGDLGPQSISAIKKFQKDNGLKIDGKVGPETWAYLFPAAETSAPPQITPTVSPSPITTLPTPAQSATPSASASTLSPQ